MKHWYINPTGILKRQYKLNVNIISIKGLTGIYTNPFGELIMVKKICSATRDPYAESRVVSVLSTVHFETAKKTEKVFPSPSFS